jgi:hypothetical protein
MFIRALDVSTWPRLAACLLCLQFSFGFAVNIMDSFMKHCLNIHDFNIHDVSKEKPQTMKRGPKFVRKQTFGVVQDGMTDRPVHDMKSQQRSKHTPQ